MKNKLWLFQIPIVAVFAAAFVVTDAGINGDLDRLPYGLWLNDRVYPRLRAWSGEWTDVKFRYRGEQPPKNKVVIVAVDDPSVALLGRWPWHRDVMARLIDQLFKFHIHAVGLDLVYSEEDPRVPEQLREVLV